MSQVKTVALPGGLLEDHFDTTVRMSTYLVAYIVCDFLSVSKTTQRGVKVRRLMKTIIPPPPTVPHIVNAVNVDFSLRRTGEDRPDSLRPGHCCQAPGLLRRLLRHPLSASQTGSVDTWDERGAKPPQQPQLQVVILPADLAAIPDFQSGAMENWGLTTYRETALLYDPDKSSPSDKLAITKVIAHELAHQVADVSSL